MIEIKEISKRFGSIQVLDKVSLSLKSGACVAMIGPNGCGKTTLIKSILGMVMPNSGTIEFDGVRIAGQHEYRSKIGYMPQIGRYPENMTVRQVIDMIRQLREHSMSVDDDLLKGFDIPSIYTKRMNTLSGGTRQKVSAYLAFLFNPEVLILDEPTAGLDPLSADTLKNKIDREHRKGKLILITSHVLSELDDLVTEIVYMQEGQIVFHKKVSDLRAETNEEKISKAISHFLKGRQEWVN